MPESNKSDDSGGRDPAAIAAARKGLASLQSVSRQSIETENEENNPEKITLVGGQSGVFKAREKDGPHRDVIASLVADAIGLSDLVPTTVVRKEGNEKGSFQQFVENAKPAIDFPPLGGAVPSKGWGNDVGRAAAFDFLTGESDRHSGNWLVSDQGKTSLIDNEGAFTGGDTSSDGSMFVSKAVGEKMAVPAAVRSWDWAKIEPILKEQGLKNSEIMAAKNRLHSLQKAGSFDELFEKSGRQKVHRLPEAKSMQHGGHIPPSLPESQTGTDVILQPGERVKEDGKEYEVPHLPGADPNKDSVPAKLKPGSEVVPVDKVREKPKPLPMADGGTVPHQLPESISSASGEPAPADVDVDALRSRTASAQAVLGEQNQMPVGMQTGGVVPPKMSSQVPNWHRFKDGPPESPPEAEMASLPVATHAEPPPVAEQAEPSAAPPSAPANAQGDADYLAKWHKEHPLPEARHAPPLPDEALPVARQAPPLPEALPVAKPAQLPENGPSYEEVEKSRGESRRIPDRMADAVPGGQEIDWEHVAAENRRMGGGNAQAPDATPSAAEPTVNERPKLPERTAASGQRKEKVSSSGAGSLAGGGGTGADWIGSAQGLLSDIHSRWIGKRLPGHEEDGGGESEQSGGGEGTGSKELTAAIKELTAAVKKLTDTIEKQGRGGSGGKTPSGMEPVRGGNPKETFSMLKTALGSPQKSSGMIPDDTQAADKPGRPGTHPPAPMR